MKPLAIGYDLKKFPHADEPLDPVAHFKATGEDIGLPPGWLDAWNARIAKTLAAIKAEKRHLMGTEFDHNQDDHGKWADGPGSGTPKEGQSKSLEAAAEAGGFSYRRFGGAPKGGYMVSPYKQAEVAEDVSTFDPSDVAGYRRKFRGLLGKPDHYLGGWRDGDMIYLDISIRAETIDAAAALARKHGQLAIYDVSTGQTIRTEDVK